MRSQNGFTLVELLVTVAIIGILAAFAIATFEEYRGRVYDISAKTLLREMITDYNATLIDYKTPQDFNTKLGGGGVYYFDKQQGTEWSNLNMKNTVFPNIVFKDPDLVIRVAMSYDGKAHAIQIITGHCKSHEATRNDDGTIALNGWAWRYNVPEITRGYHSAFNACH